MTKRAWLLAFAVLGVSMSAAARAAAEERPAPAPVPLLTPEEEAKTFTLPKGFRAEVVAAEPMVEHPVAIAFDPRGRMWVAEMRGYMPNLNGSGELKPIGRVSVLEDTDGDGRMDKSTVFLDNLVLPRAVAPVGDGVLIGTPPKLLFCRDTDGDGKCDEQKVIASDFGVPENPENGANGLVYGLDNWIYSADWGTRIRWKGNGEFELSPVPVMGQWGMTRDDWGRWYFNTNSDSLRGALVPPHYSSRNPKSPMSLADTRLAKDQHVWPANASTVNRGYRPGFLQENGRLAEFTAACGPHVYRGDLLPKDWCGNVFICEATSAMVRREVLTENGIGLPGKNAYDHQEFLTSTYERFRPVNVATGPEGALYIVDMHHGIIQHKMSLTSYAREGYQKKQLDKHLLTGRIFRIVPDDGAPVPHLNLAAASTAELVGYLKHSNGWWRDTAQRLLVERKDEAAVGPLKEMAAHAESPVHRVDALWTLEGMGALDADAVRGAIKDSDAHVRANGMRLAESLKADGDIWADALRLSRDESPVVREQVMLTAVGLGTEQGDAVVGAMLAERGNEPAIREAAVSGLAGREVPFLQRLAADSQWATRDSGKAAVMTDIARSVIRRDDPADVKKLVDLIGARPLQDWQRLAMAEAIPAKRQDDFGLAKWIDVDREPATIAVLSASAVPAVRKSAERVSGLFRWPGKVMPERPKAAPLTAKQQGLFEIGKVTYTQLCGQCHQPDGRGQEGKAPPLAGSPWVLGPDGRLIRIVLHGLRGPITVGDRTYSMDMPGLGVLKDDQIAGVLTYIRRSWGHEAPAVDPAVVQNTRDWNQARRDGWTEPELLKIR